MTSTSSPIQELIGRYENKTNLVFKPTRSFYQQVGINHLRFAKLARGQLRPDSEEIRGLLTYFNQFFPVSADEFINL